jgi:hypothetical protein
MAKKADDASTGTTTSEGTTSPASPRLSVQLTADGKGIAWDRMRPQTQEQLRALLGTAPGAAAATTAAADAFDPALCAVAYDALSTLMVGLARRSGYTEDAAGVLRFTADEKAVLAEPTAKVLNKYVPAGKYQDELMLGVLLTTIIAGKLTMLRRSAQVIHMAPRQAVPEGASPDTAPIA